MSGRREIVTKRWETEAGCLKLTEHEKGPHCYLESQYRPGIDIPINKADLLALAELLKQEKP